jgi:hypothetical protein
MTLALQKTPQFVGNLAIQGTVRYAFGHRLMADFKQPESNLVTGANYV